MRTIAFAGALALAACKSDPAPAPAPDAAPISPDAPCMGTFAGLTQGKLAALVNPSGKCGPPGDVAIICAGNTATIATQCWERCAQPPAMFRSCATGCIRTMFLLGEGCAGCYADVLACIEASCRGPCMPTLAAPGCLQCQIEKGCRSGFSTCSGLPGVSGADAGARDALAD